MGKEAVIFREVFEVWMVVLVVIITVVSSIIVIALQQIRDAILKTRKQ